MRRPLIIGGILAAIAGLWLAARGGGASDLPETFPAALPPTNRDVDDRIDRDEAQAGEEPVKARHECSGHGITWVPLVAYDQRGDARGLRRRDGGGNH